MAEIDPDALTRTSRDRADLGARLQDWLRATTGDDDAEVGPVTSPESTGMSSETLLFDATVEGRTTALVARVAPDVSDVPVFPSYDLELQFRVIRLVGEHTTVPVPTTRWLETDPGVLGTPFFVMERVDGVAAPDVPPYVFEGWLHDLDDDGRATVERNAVGVLAGIHGIDRSSVDTSFLELDRPGDTPLERHVAEWDAYHAWAVGDRVHPIIEDGRRWLGDNMPTETDAVVSWGDSRIGNMLWQGTEVTAVLDWEMAGVGPRELDLGWMLFLHRFFQDLAERFDLPGIPGFMERERVAERYAEATGHEPVDLHWYEVWTAWRFGLIMSRIHDRTVHFGQGEWTDDVDAPIMFRHLIAEMIEA